MATVEFEPVTSGENTEIKVPVTPFEHDDDHDDDQFSTIMPNRSSIEQGDLP